MRMLRTLSFTLAMMLALALPGDLKAGETPAQLSYELAQYGYTTVHLGPEKSLRPYMDETAAILDLLDPFESTLYFYRLEGQPGGYQAVLESSDYVQSRKEATHQEVLRWAKSLPSGLSDRQLAKAINAELIRRVDYDGESYQRYIKGKPIDDRIFSADGALIDGVAVCDGYAGAAMLMARQVGLPCIKIVGTAKGISHAWNKVYLRDEGRWLHLDITNNDLPDLLDPNDVSKQPAFLVSDKVMIEHGISWDSLKAETAKAISFPTVVPEAIHALSQANIVYGRGPGNYAEDAHLMRQELAALLVRLYGVEGQTDGLVSTFPDVDPWAEESVAYCLQQGLLLGYPDGSFGARKAVTKQEWAAIVLRLSKPQEYWEWMQVEDHAETHGLVNPGRRSGIWGQEALRADVFDSLYRSKDAIGWA